MLAGEQTLDEIILNPLAGTPTTASRCTRQEGDRRWTASSAWCSADDGTAAPSTTACCCATGSNPFILPVPGKDLQGVIAYRDIADTNAMIDAARRYKHAVVIGGGLLGLEAANGLMLRGMQVTVVHIMPVADGAPARRRGRQAAAASRWKSAA